MPWECANLRIGRGPHPNALLERKGAAHFTLALVQLVFVAGLLFVGKDHRNKTPRRAVMVARGMGTELRGCVTYPLSLRERVRVRAFPCSFRNGGRFQDQRLFGTSTLSHTPLARIYTNLPLTINSITVMRFTISRSWSMASPSRICSNLSARATASRRADGTWSIPDGLASSLATRSSK